MDLDDSMEAMEKRASSLVGSEVVVYLNGWSPALCRGARELCLWGPYASTLLQLFMYETNAIECTAFEKERRYSFLLSRG